MSDVPTSEFHRLSRPHPFPGKLIVLEGIDGCGKSTQVDLLTRYLEARGHSIICTEWNSGKVVGSVTRFNRKVMAFTPTTFALLHATDFAHRQAYDIIPPLKAGMVVLADRYVYTAFARDVSRGVDRNWARKVYNFAVRPDLILYLRVTMDVVISRLLITHTDIKPYEAGMDLNISNDRYESYRVFQNRLIREFNLMADEFDFVTLDAAQPVPDLQAEIRRNVETVLPPPGQEGQPPARESARPLRRQIRQGKR